MSDHGAALRAKYPGVKVIDAGEPLRHLGLRDAIHPFDAVASLFPSQEAADAFAAANLEDYGHPNLGSYADGDGVIGVLDMRPALAQMGGRPCDPLLPDDWKPARGAARG